MRGVEGGGLCSRVVKGNWNFLCACQFFNHEVHESSLLVERETPIIGGVPLTPIPTNSAQLSSAPLPFILVLPFFPS